MKFGKVEPSLEHLQDLPPTHPIIHELQPSKDTTVYLGGTQWGIKPWVGTWYAPGTPQRAFLSAYGNQFGCVELNATHYRLFDPEKFSEWASMVPDSFTFLPKLPQSISHYRRLNNTAEVVNDFCAGVRMLGKKAGPSFLQMPENFKSDKFSELENWLLEWPSDITLSVELRHSSWFDDSSLFNDLLAILHSRNMGLVLTDAPGRPDVLHMAVTSPLLMVRYAGWNGHALESRRIGNWAHRIAEWQSSGLKEIYFCIHQPDSTLTPETAIQLSNELQKASEPVNIIGIPSPLSLF